MDPAGDDSMEEEIEINEIISAAEDDAAPEDAAPVSCDQQAAESGTPPDSPAPANAVADYTEDDGFGDFADVTPASPGAAMSGGDEAAFADFSAPAPAPPLPPQPSPAGDGLLSLSPAAFLQAACALLGDFLPVPTPAAVQPPSLADLASSHPKLRGLPGAVALRADATLATLQWQGTPSEARVLRRLGLEAVPNSAPPQEGYATRTSNLGEDSADAALALGLQAAPRGQGCSDQPPAASVAVTDPEDEPRTPVPVAASTPAEGSDTQGGMAEVGAAGSALGGDDDAPLDPFPLKESISMEEWAAASAAAPEAREAEAVPAEQPATGKSAEEVPEGDAGAMLPGAEDLLAGFNPFGDPEMEQSNLDAGDAAGGGLESGDPEAMAAALYNPFEGAPPLQTGGGGDSADWEAQLASPPKIVADVSPFQQAAMEGAGQDPSGGEGGGVATALDEAEADGSSLGFNPLEKEAPDTGGVAAADHQPVEGSASEGAEEVDATLSPRSDGNDAARQERPLEEDGSSPCPAEDMDDLTDFGEFEDAPAVAPVLDAGISPAPEATADCRTASGQASSSGDAVEPAHLPAEVAATDTQPPGVDSADDFEAFMAGPAPPPADIDMEPAASNMAAEKGQHAVLEEEHNPPLSEAALGVPGEELGVMEGRAANPLPEAHASAVAEELGEVEEPFDVADPWGDGDDDFDDFCAAPPAAEGPPVAALAAGAAADDAEHAAVAALVARLPNLPFMLENRIVRPGDLAAAPGAALP